MSESKSKQAVLKVAYDWDKAKECFYLTSVAHNVHYNPLDFVSVNAKLAADGHLHLKITGKTDTRIILNMTGIESGGVAPIFTLKDDKYPFDYPVSPRVKDLGGLLPVIIEGPGNELDFDLEPNRECSDPAGPRNHTSWHIGC